MLNEYNYSIDYRETKKHGNADALSCLPVGPDTKFDEEESDADVDTIHVCMMKTISMQIKPIDSKVLAKETSKDPVLANVMHYVREGWPSKSHTDDASTDGYSVNDFRKMSSSLSVVHGCLLHGTRIVIPTSLKSQVLQLLHIGHFRYATHETIDTNSSLLARNRQ